MLRIALALFFFLVSIAASAEDHLFPLDLAIDYYRNAAGKVWLDGMGNDDRILVEFDVFHAFGPAEFLGVIQPIGGKTYTLDYFKGSYDPKKVVHIKVEIPAEFANAVADKADAVIRHDTHYDLDD